MDKYKKLLNNFVIQSKNILGNNLVGIYLHGSAVMGCFNPKTSDIDLIVVVKGNISNNLKLKYMDIIVSLNKDAPAKGIELSIVNENVCNPFVYPTPFELHFSSAHLDWYQSNPKEYIDKMKGIDKDLAAHFTIIYYRGKCIYGKSIDKVFGVVNREDYFDSIWNDISEATNEITDNAMYIVLNLCRVLAYKQEGLIYSKLEGGNWGINKLPEKYHRVIEEALKEYSDDIPLKVDKGILKEYAEYMLKQINQI